MPYKPTPYTITDEIASHIAAIAELTGRISSTAHLSLTPMLRRANRIRTVHSTLAIEQNTLTLDQVTAVLNGKHVLAPPKDVAEVKNAYEIYDKLNSLDPCSADDLLLAHRIMMQGLTEDAGTYRDRPVGVVDQNGQIVHFGTLPAYVPNAMDGLLDWLQSSPTHPLIKGCVFHYEFELIHPFSDGNGRTGRLWHTLILSKWNPIFAWLPVESVVHDRQQEYYDAINQSNDLVDSTPFLSFMLSAIRTALSEAEAESADNGKNALITSADKPPRLRSERESILAYLDTHDSATSAELCELLGLKPTRIRTIILREMAEEGLIVTEGANRNRRYRKKQD